MGLEKGLLIGKDGVWKILMEEIYGRNGLFSAHYIKTEIMAEDELEGEEIFELKRRQDSEKSLRDMIYGPEPENYIAKLNIHYTTEIDLKKVGPQVSVKIASKDITEAIKMMSVPLLFAGYEVKYEGILFEA